MFNRSKLLIGCTAAFASLLALESTSFAWEDDNFDWSSQGQSFGLVSAYMSNFAWANFGNPDEVWPTGDVDYHIVTCGQAGKKISDLRVTFSHASGDIDIAAYTLNGTYIGGSAGTTDTEVIATTNRNAIQLRVFGWSGATNTYNVFFQCT
jgi:hypothetical protein